MSQDRIDELEEALWCIAQWSDAYPLLEKARQCRGRPRTRGKTFRVSLNRRLCFELERAAAARGLSSEVLPTSIGRVVVADG
jgi:hypothetical protein